MAPGLAYSRGLRLEFRPCIANSMTLANFTWLFNAGAIDRLRIEALARADFVGRKQNLVVCGFCQNPYRRPKGSAHRCELLRRTPRPRGRVVTDRRDGERGTEPRDSAPTRWQSRVRLLARCATANTPTTRPCDTSVAAIRHFLPKIAREWLNQVTIVDTAASGLNTDAVGRGRRSGQIRKGPPERAICSGRRRRRWSIRLSLLASSLL